MSDPVDDIEFYGERGIQGGLCFFCDQPVRWVRRDGKHVCDDHKGHSKAVVELAWLMWCYNEGYRTPEDRAILTNWFGEPQSNVEDEATRQVLLAMATDILTTWGREQR